MVTHSFNVVFEEHKYISTFRLSHQLKKVRILAAVTIRKWATIQSEDMNSNQTCYKGRINRTLLKKKKKKERKKKKRKKEKEKKE